MSELECEHCKQVGCSFSCMKRQRDEALAAFGVLMAKQTERSYPRGQLTPEDEGELSLAVTVKNGAVVVLFGKPLAWFGLGPAEAKGLAAVLIKRAEEIE